MSIYTTWINQITTELNVHLITSLFVGIFIKNILSSSSLLMKSEAIDILSR